MKRIPAETAQVDPLISDNAAWHDARGIAQATRAAEARKASGRRRRIDPATCERDYTAREMEFLNAIQEYKRSSGRMFPTWSEVLEVVQALGYRKVESASA